MTDSAPAVQVTLDNVAGKTISLVYSNGKDARPVASLPVTSTSLFASLASEPSTVNQVPSFIRDHKVPRVAGDDRPAARLERAPMAVVAPPSVGSTRSWIDQHGRQRPSTLERRWQAPDGRWLNLWVENGEIGNISASMLDTLQTRYSSPDTAHSAYSMVTRLAGDPWGEHGDGALIPTLQDLNVVLLNLTPDNRPYGLIGYFWDVNAYTRTFLEQFRPVDAPYTNEALALFVDTETLARGGVAGMNIVLTTMAHEMTHMVEFYQRTVRGAGGQDFGFDTWLNEMVALMMEDVVSMNLIPGYNSLRDVQFGSWISQRPYNCDFIWYRWDDQLASSCFSYPIAASYGGYLLRQYGIDFYRQLLARQSSTDSFTELDEAIRLAKDGHGAVAALSDWAPSIALLPPSASAPRYGFPARAEQGFTLPAINGPSYATMQRLPAVSPGEFKPGGLFLAARKSSGSTYSETVPVPEGSTLSVVVQ